MAATVVRSYSKINLGLRIGPPRADGFHHLVTLYQTLALHDLVTVEAQPAPVTRITVSSNDERVPLDARNTAFRMVTMALSALRLDAEVHIHLLKQLPPQGGMGAGSANAAAALLGLERQLQRAGVPRMDGPQRLHLAEAVGSDVPLFLLGGTVFGHNRGELVVPYPDLPQTACLVVAPLHGSSTPAAFRAWDERITRLTPSEAHGRLSELCRVYASAFASSGAEAVRPGSDSGLTANGTLGVSDVLDGNATRQEGDLAGDPLSALVRTGIENDFEEVVFQQHPSLREIKRAIVGRPAGDSPEGEDTSALCAMLSGSGSSLFGLFRTEADARAAERRVDALQTGARTFVTRTVDRPAYWREMFVE